MSRCSALDVVDGSQQAVQAVVAEGDTDGRPLLWLVVADLQLEPLEQGTQQRFGRRSQPVGREQGKQIQQVHRLLIGLRPLGDHGPQLRQFGLLLAVQFSEPPSDLLEQGPAGVVALLQRANQARLAALEVGNGSPERLHPPLPGRDLAAGDLGEILGEQGTPLGAEQAPREELQHAAQQQVLADQDAGGMLGLPLCGHLPAEAALPLAGVVDVVASGLASEFAAHLATTQLTGHQRAQRVAAARLGVAVQARARPGSAPLRCHVLRGGKQLARHDRLVGWPWRPDPGLRRIPPVHSPFAAFLASPITVRSTMVARSNSANTPSIWTIIRPAAPNPSTRPLLTPDPVDQRGLRNEVTWFECESDHQRAQPGARHVGQDAVVRANLKGSKHPDLHLSILPRWLGLPDG